eukprot:GHVP01055576.1.p1 GENE.GHVP01055576.1~~GHVP01055576.1.p1  ORF type:complete len:456 (-),score=62.19 GHVP01055576.1:26-1393(-)
MEKLEVSSTENVKLIYPEKKITIEGLIEEVQESNTWTILNVISRGCSLIDRMKDSPNIEEDKSLFAMSSIRKLASFDRFSEATVLFKILGKTDLQNMIDYLTTYILDTSPERLNSYFTFVFKHYTDEMKNYTENTLMRPGMFKIYLLFYYQQKRYLDCILLTDLYLLFISQKEDDTCFLSEMDSGISSSIEIIEKYRSEIPEEFIPPRNGLFLFNTCSIHKVEKKLKKKRSLLTAQMQISKLIEKTPFQVSVQEITVVLLESMLYQKCLSFLISIDLPITPIVEHISIKYSIQETLTEIEKSCFLSHNISIENRSKTLAYSLLLKIYMDKITFDGYMTHRKCVEIIYSLSPKMGIPGWLNRTLVGSVPDRLLKIYIDQGLFYKAYEFCSCLLSSEIRKAASGRTSTCIPYRHLIQEAMHLCKRENLSTIEIESLFFYYCKTISVCLGEKALRQME